MIRSSRGCTACPAQGRAVRLSYALTSALTLDASYAHVFIAKADMDRTDLYYEGSAAQTGVTTRSAMSGNVDMIATSVTARF